MRRLVVVGNAGSGKSWLAARLASRLDVPHVELDSLFHMPEWREVGAEEFRAAVALRTNDDGWVVDGNYAAVRDLVWDRADTVVWLDLPRSLVMRRVAWRTITRAVTRRELWNGNRERLRNILSTDPDRSIILWSWVKHTEYQQRYTAAMEDPRWTHLTFVRLRTPRAVEHFLATVAGSARESPSTSRRR